MISGISCPVDVIEYIPVTEFLANIISIPTTNQAIDNTLANKALYLAILIKQNEDELMFAMAKLNWLTDSFSSIESFASGTSI